MTAPLAELEELLDRWPETEPEELREQALAVRGMPLGAARMALAGMAAIEQRICALEDDKEGNL